MEFKDKVIFLVRYEDVENIPGTLQETTFDERPFPNMYSCAVDTCYGTTYFCQMSMNEVQAPLEES